MKNKTEQCFCKSYYDEDNVLRDCTCGKCDMIIKEKSLDFQKEFDCEFDDMRIAKDKGYVEVPIIWFEGLKNYIEKVKESDTNSIQFTASLTALLGYLSSYTTILKYNRYEDETNEKK